MSLQSDIVEFLAGERKPMKRQDLAAAIQREACHNRAWPKATFEQWDWAISDAIKAGQLEMIGETVWLATKPVEKTDKQLDLF